MSRRTIPLTTRIRYEGRAQTIDRRASSDAALEALPDPIWHTVSMTLKSHFLKAANGMASKSSSAKRK